MRKLFCYLEFASFRHGTRAGADNALLFVQIVRELRAGTLLECEVVDVQHQLFRDATVVPDFHHTSACACPNPEKFGVIRCPGVVLLIAGEPGSDIIGAYELASGRARLEVVGFSLITPTVPRRALKRIADPDLVKTMRGPQICWKCLSETCEHWKELSQ